MTKMTDYYQISPGNDDGCGCYVWGTENQAHDYARKIPGDQSVRKMAKWELESNWDYVDGELEEISPFFEFEAIDLTK